MAILCAGAAVKTAPQSHQLHEIGGGGLEAIFRQAVCAMSVTDGDGLWLYRCVLREIRTRLCRTHDGLAGLRSAVAAKIAIFA